MNTENIFTSYADWLAHAEMPKGQRAVLEASITLFSKQGFDGTSTAQIANLAGVSQGTIFKYYHTKQDLLQAIITPVVQHLVPKMRDAFVDPLPTQADLATFIHFIVQDRFNFLQQNAEVIQIFVSELLISPQVRELFATFLKKTAPILNDSPLAKLQTSGQIRQDLSLLDIVRTLIGQLLTYFFQTKFSPKPLDSTADLARIETVLVAALRP
ncbi:TetR/AcrR family transcriptional regulator [uncultured Secundilactobacillus sp.]|uniref:TetR/AcrR family transcriptional regulator n=1 Tax=uncultured Secundilactobacillus sp. TaxID=2813935 RepID=UPI002591008F|nr:TetR/AcrR family transcriptional regulator [uncultured Secundilactobacillus sp.]